MGKKFKYWLTVNLAKTRQTSAAFDGRVGVDNTKLEKVQERALRFVYEDYNSSYEELLHKAKVPSLQIRRIRTMALETFKIVLTN
jgi:hypothetical protein